MNNYSYGHNWECLECGRDLDTISDFCSRQCEREYYKKRSAECDNCGTPVASGRKYCTLCAIEQSA